METQRFINMTYNEMMQLEEKERYEALKLYRKYLRSIINKLHVEASKYKSFSFSKCEDDLTPKEIVTELINFLESKDYSREQIKEILLVRVKR